MIEKKIKNKKIEAFWPLGVPESPPVVHRGGSATLMGKPSKFFLEGFGSVTPRAKTLDFLFFFSAMGWSNHSLWATGVVEPPRVGCGSTTPKPAGLEVSEPHSWPMGWFGHHQGPKPLIFFFSFLQWGRPPKTGQESNPSSFSFFNFVKF
jgi:hypothetical protein